jgi:hypothetical protein
VSPASMTVGLGGVVPRKLGGRRVFCCVHREEEPSSVVVA